MIELPKKESRKSARDDRREAPPAAAAERIERSGNGLAGPLRQA